MQWTRRGFSGLMAGAALAVALPRAWPVGTALMDEPLTGLSLAEASRRIRAGTVTSTRLVEALLDRIATYDARLNCYITVMREEALAQAARLDAEAREGRFRGPLHGIPIGLKDNIDTAGTRTTGASAMFKDRVPSEDAAVVARLKRGGAVLLGKLNMRDLALGSGGDRICFDPARSPWSLDGVSAETTCGPAVAVAAELLYGAVGTEGGGDMRGDSGWCGGVRLRPTSGLVSMRGIIPFRASSGHCCPLARTVEDCALMLGEMAGYDPLDIGSVRGATADCVWAMHRPVKRLRLGTPVNLRERMAPAVRAALDVLGGLTAGVTLSGDFDLAVLPAGEIDNSGRPAITLPCGFTEAGMPIGLTIAGPRFQEGRILALAFAYQQATDWHMRRPALTERGVE
jgi:aspartyl-tRNA(Asn)/glutamyl-tRNA(Gln) amidotransferase subunit A